MSFNVSSVTTGNFSSVYLSGTNGIAGSSSTTTNPGLYYSTNSGQTWTVSNINTGSFASVFLSGSGTGIAGSSSNTGLYYTSNNGLSWTVSSITTQSFTSVFLLTNGTGIAVSATTIYYTTNSGITWTQSTLTGGGNVAGNFTSVSMSGTNAVASSTTGIYYSSTSGQTWTQSASVPTNGFSSISISGTNALAGSNTGANNRIGTYFSIDSGVTWTQGNTSKNIVINGVFLTGTTGVIATASGLDYVTFTGTTANFTKSGTNTGNFSSVFMSGTNAVAGSGANTGLYISTNSGTSWTQSNVTTGSFSSVSMSGTSGIAGTSTTGGGTLTGIYYSASPLCYEQNSNILCIENNQEVYKKISDIKVGDLVKTYKHGNKKVKLIGYVNYMCFNNLNNIECLYKHKTNNLIVTGGHSMLVDELSEDAINEHNKYGFANKIDDKLLLLAAANKDFEKLVDNQLYVLYHLVLENDNKFGHYGIYTNDGLLSETCSENAFIKFYRK